MSVQPNNRPPAPVTATNQGSWGSPDRRPIAPAARYAAAARAWTGEPDGGALTAGSADAANTHSREATAIPFR